ncbi:hypothetical protein R9C00_03395 [Flammeovirgaceae bacterium SG7u.111]|nr:hypothetical protein [Flammeovirgaceae bacterium SG7u.132]WPO36488.1 hypothetical protein R9C00_03395 [Flammeovirgaceae bacterium SG7u.111]
MTTNLNSAEKRVYPEFVANQVLTQKDLNNIVGYLDEQNRLTRTQLVGSGVVCGLEVSRGENNAIVISNGLGITSEGFLVREELKKKESFGGEIPEVEAAEGEEQHIATEKKYTHYKEYNIPQKYFHLKKEFDKNEPKTTTTAASTEEKIVTAFELLESSMEGATSLEGRTEAFLKSHSVVLFLEQEVAYKDSCNGDCNSTGIKRSFDIKKLLIANTILDDLLKVGYEIGDATVDTFFKGKYLLESPRLRQFGYTESLGKISLTNINSVEIFYNRYYHVCELGIGDISAKLNNLYHTFSTVFTFSIFKGYTHSSLKNAFSGVQTTLQSYLQKDYDIQYFYAFLGDLVLAYEEFRAAAFDLMDDCGIGNERFPYFLSLGEAVVDEPCKGSPYRMDFTQPPIYNGNQKRVKEVKVLYERLLFLLEGNKENTLVNFEIPKVDEIKDESGTLAITKTIPSQKRGSALSQRAIPYYYKEESVAALKPKWSFEKWRKCQSDAIYNFYTTPAEAFTWHMESPDFYRIEGQVGKGYAEVMGSISDQRLAYNLPFDLVGVKLGSRFADDDFDIKCYFELLSLLNAELLCVLCEKLTPFLMNNAGSLPGTSPRLEAWRAIVGQIEAGENISTTSPTFGEEDQAFIKLFSACKKSSSTGRKTDPLFFMYLFRNELSQGQFGVSVLPVFFEMMNTLVALINGPLSETGCDIEKLSYDYLERFISTTKNLIAELEKQGGSDDDGNDNELISSLKALINCCEITKFKNLKTHIDCYKSQFLFHNFALKHPGLEHGGGVPRGGTFVVVYAETENLASFLNTNNSDKNLHLLRHLLGQENEDDVQVSISNFDKRIVVGDFYLPYSCASDCPPVATLVERPKPVIYLNPSVFCGGVEGEYGIFLFPQGGEIVEPRSAAIRKDAASGKYYFVPSKVEASDYIANSKKIKLVYLVNGSKGETEVTVFPAVNAEFSGLKNFYCIDENTEEPTQVTLLPDDTSVESTFSAKIVGGGDLPLTKGRLLSLSGRSIPEEGQVMIEVMHKVVSNESTCPNSLTKQSLLVLKPNVEFAIEYQGEPYSADENGVVQICIEKEGEKIQLVPVEGGGEFAADVSSVAEDGTYTVSFPAGSNDKRVTVQFIYTIKRAYNLPDGTEEVCEESNTVTALIAERVNTEFTGLDESYCIDRNPKLGTKVTLVPADPTVKGVFIVDGNALEGNIVNLNASLLPAEQEETTLEVRYETIGGGALCPSSTSKLVELKLRPAVEFTLLEENTMLLLSETTTLGGEFSSKAFVIEDELEGRVEFEKDEENPRLFRLNFEKVFEESEDAKEAFISITYSINPEDGCANSFTANEFQIFRQSEEEEPEVVESPTDSLDAIDTALSENFVKIVRVSEEERTAPLGEFRKGLKQFLEHLETKPNDIKTGSNEAAIFDKLEVFVKKFKTENINFNAGGATSKPINQTLKQVQKGEKKKPLLEENLEVILKSVK